MNKTTSTSRLCGEDGASLVEYALLLALIAIVCIGALTFLGQSTSADLTGNTSSLFMP